jgi:hypothetical protein
MKEALRRKKRFSSDKEVIVAVQKLVKEATKKLFSSDGIKKLAKRWNRCFYFEGDCIKK